jgi:hypothetical protein
MTIYVKVTIYDNGHVLTAKPDQRKINKTQEEIIS